MRWGHRWRILKLQDAEMINNNRQPPFNRFGLEAFAQINFLTIFHFIIAVMVDV